MSTMIPVWHLYVIVYLLVSNLVVWRAIGVWRQQGRDVGDYYFIMALILIAIAWPIITVASIAEKTVKWIMEDASDKETP